MSKRLGRLAGWFTLVAVCSAIVFIGPLTLFGASAVLSALFLAVVLGAFAVAWVAEFMYRKAYPNLFRPFEKNRSGRKVAEDRGE
jgi:O-antigen/teichoic acid export membrane protein